MSSARARNGNPAAIPRPRAASRRPRRDVEAVERLEHAEIPVHVEAGIEQPELGLELLMYGSGLVQALPQ